MHKNKLIIFALSVTMLLFAGCSDFKNAQILKEDQAQVAITLNKGFDTTVFATNTGERIQPCSITGADDAKQKSAEIKTCDADEQAAEGKILHEETYNVVVREGSICITIISGSRKYKFCDPPFNLGF